MKSKTKDAFTQLGITFGVYAVVLWALTGSVWAVNAWSCGNVCEANGDEPDYAPGIGCFCDDGNGLYNPQDSRGEGR